MAKILIIDDSGLSRRMLRKILESRGHTVVEAEDGVVGIEKYYLERPDMVFLDITMAGMDGWEVLEQVRGMDANAHVIMATADIQKSSQEMARERGAAGFVNKPFDPESVLRSVESALGGKA